MRVAATNTIAKMLDEACKAKGLDYQVRYITCDAEAYRMHIGDIWDAEYYGDWLERTNKFRAIEVCYDPNDYACPKYLTTEEIGKVFRRNRCQTAEELIDRLVEAVEI